MFTNVIYYLTALNVLTLLVYMDDKINTKLDKRRTSERTLLLLSAAGGSVRERRKDFTTKTETNVEKDRKTYPEKRKDKTIKTKRHNLFKQKHTIIKAKKHYFFAFFVSPYRVFIPSQSADSPSLCAMHHPT